MNIAAINPRQLPLLLGELLSPAQSLAEQLRLEDEVAVLSKLTSITVLGGRSEGFDSGIGRVILESISHLFEYGESLFTPWRNSAVPIQFHTLDAPITLSRLGAVSSTLLRPFNPDASVLHGARTLLELGRDREPLSAHAQSLPEFRPPVSVGLNLGSYVPKTAHAERPMRSANPFEPIRRPYEREGPSRNSARRNSLVGILLLGLRRLLDRSPFSGTIRAQ